MWKNESIFNAFACSWMSKELRLYVEYIEQAGSGSTYVLVHHYWIPMKKLLSWRVPIFSFLSNKDDTVARLSYQQLCQRSTYSASRFVFLTNWCWSRFTLIMFYKQRFISNDFLTSLFLKKIKQRTTLFSKN